MRRPATLLVALALPVALLAAPAHASYQPPVRCTSKINTAQSPLITYDPPPANGPAVKGYAEMVVGYQSCKNRLGPDYIHVTWARYTFLPSGARDVDCKSYPKERAVEGMKFRPYFWDDSGRNYRRKLVFAPCKATGPWSAYRRYPTTHDPITLYPAGRVKFRAALTMVVNEWSDVDGSTRVGRLYP